jgi:cell division protease FtsH
MNADPLTKVSIIPHDRVLGATEQISRENYHNLSRTYLLSRIGIMLGGRVAEKLAFNDITNGAAEDLKQATRPARRVVAGEASSDLSPSPLFIETRAPLTDPGW